MSTRTVERYFAALDRLKKGRPLIVPTGTKITNDAVSLEAGLKRGCIKKSRPQFAELVAAIATAAMEQAKPEREHAERLSRVRYTAEELQKQLDAALAREFSLLVELFEARKQLAALSGDRVLPIRRNGPAASQ
ncbi:hypothetical protein E4K72_00925 [Oxalobacteraceae bacterium OM1]|nr:hypothetical protein E4K72_00925 [Oxalobacteraceae bacterium OM1]